MTGLPTEFRFTLDALEVDLAPVVDLSDRQLVDRFREAGEALSCRRSDPDEWFPDGRVEKDQLHARRLCICPLRAACLEWALRRREMDGIWGGCTPDVRAALIRRRITRLRKGNGDHSEAVGGSGTSTGEVA